VSAPKIFAARLAGCSVFDPYGARVGRVLDVLVVRRKSAPPRVVGLITEIPGRRRVFLPISRVTSIAGGQVITTGLINMRRFQQRGGEVRVIAELIGRNVQLADNSGTATIEDAALSPTAAGDWEISQLYLRRPRTGPSPFSRGATLYAPWDKIVELDAGDESQSATQLIASMSELLPADLANAILDLPEQRRIEVAEELPDERLADVLEELPENEQVDLLAKLDDNRAADVLDKMDPDDAADLIASMDEERGETLLELMEPEEAEDVRLLLSYGPDTAGGMMTTEPVIVSSETTVAEALAMIRRREVHPALAAVVCVTLPPYEAPTGRFLGLVHFQRLLRHPPHERLGTLVDSSVEPMQVTTPAAEVIRTLASYDLVSVPVVDQNQRLLGVVTVDDALDRLLPDDWRSHEAGDDE